MKQPLYPSSRALRVIIAAVIMIIASATTAWAQTGEGGTGQGEIGGGGEIVPDFDATIVPLTLEPTEACTITVTNPRNGMQYSVDGMKKAMTETTTIEVSPRGGIEGGVKEAVAVETTLNLHQSHTPPPAPPLKGWGVVGGHTEGRAPTSADNGRPLQGRCYYGRPYFVGRTDPSAGRTDPRLLRGETFSLLHL